MNRKMYRLLFFIINLVSCTLVGEKNSSAEEMNNPQISQEQVEKSSDEFVVESWVKKSSNNNGKYFVVMGSLLKNGFRLGDNMMYASWPDPSAEGGVVHCDLYAHHGVGQCVALTDQLTPGEFVPVTIKFEYQGHYYYGDTGFTPQ